MYMVYDTALRRGVKILLGAIVGVGINVLVRRK